MKKLYRFTALVMTAVILLLAGLPMLTAYGTEAKPQKKLVVGMSADFPPYEFHKVVNGKDTIVGFDVDIAKEIAKDLGAEMVPEDMSFDSLLPALQSGRVDLVLSGMTPTDERRKSIDFSDVYYHSKQVIMVRPEDKDKYPTMATLKGEKLGAQKGSIQEKIAQRVPNATVTSLDKISDLVLQLRTQRINAVVIEDTVAKGYTLDGTVTLAKAVPEDKGAETAVGIRKGNTELLASVNKTLARLKADGSIEKFSTEASALSAERQVSSNSIVDIFLKYRSFYVTGIGNTLLVSALGVLFGFIIGLIISLLRMCGVRIIEWLGTAYVEVLRGTPMLVQLMIIHYGIALTLGVDFTPLQSGIITLSLNSSAYLAEIFRAGIQGVDRGQMEAARSLGMGRGKAMRHVILPQAFKSILPAIGNEFVTIIKESSIISIIGMVDIMYQAQVVKNITYEGLSPFLIAGAFYFVMTFSLSKLQGLWERKLRASDHR
ncbi:ABC transporter substrate-binding protein/permease [Paenibacillus sp. 1-18]|uniref:ABC transporter substrate-binding protein/permease n=1 Tax=Paenibacillus sp. 1-18 TaxID=1333846 RepID=UPI00046EA555|nr:ABC transporter substrate-binding protein/permease [Paenibacillus sp. 1-18]